MLLDWLPFAVMVIAFFIVWRRRSRLRDTRKKVRGDGSHTWTDSGPSGASSHGTSAGVSAAAFGAGASGGAGAAADWSDSAGDFLSVDSGSSDSGGDSGGGDGGSSD